MIRLTISLLFVSLIAAQLADVDRMMNDLGKFLSTSRFTESEKRNVREDIAEALLQAGLSSMTQTFLVEDSESLDAYGRNVLSIQAGPYYGTQDDRIVVLCANYDTPQDVPGVDDNGSGVTALLETARVLSTLDKLYNREYTIIYAFVDKKHQGLAGSHALVSEVLLPILSTSNATVEAVLVLDGLLNYDPFPTAQATPPNFQEALVEQKMHLGNVAACEMHAEWEWRATVLARAHAACTRNGRVEMEFPDEAALLSSHGHMGDFLQVILRRDFDERLLNVFERSFNRSAAASAMGWQFRPWALPVKLLLDDLTLERMFLLHPLLYSDHSSFYFHNREMLNFPTLYLTDTLKYRGVKQYCPHCDGLYLINEQNLGFLQLNTDAVIFTVIQMSKSGAVDHIDELQAFYRMNDRQIHAYSPLGDQG